ncbi:MAG: hypothetical protein NVSMB48_22680 [Marmoricola sp.]
MTTLTSVEQEILDRLAAGLRERLGGIDGHLDASWVAAAMLDAIPAVHPFEQLGPFYDTAGVSRWLGISRQALHQKVKADQLLAVTTGDGQRLYQAWQFAPDGRPLIGLVDLLRVLNPAAADPWTVAVWLTRPVPERGNRSAVDVMRSLRPVGPRGAEWDELIVEAAEDASRWSR